MTTKDIIEALGRDVLKAEFDVTDKTVWAVGDANVFPSKWFARMDEICAEKAIVLPRSLFSWKPAPAETAA